MTGLTVPNSAGTAAPRIATPALACDAHCHILDPRFPSPDGAAPSGMDVDSFRRLMRRLGTSRAVLVQAKHYRTDHACLLDALARLGSDAVGIGVVHPDVSDEGLVRLHEGRVRGLRFSVWNPGDTVTTIDMIEPLAGRIAPLGWHVQLHMSAAQLVAHEGLVRRLPCPVVIDHMGRLPPGDVTAQPGFAVLCRLLATGRVWVKLSGAYLDTRVGRPDYPDVSRTAQALVALAPNRLVWGSDWPHVTETEKPDDAQLLDLLTGWAGTAAARRRILVDNAAELYGWTSGSPIDR